MALIDYHDVDELKNRNEEAVWMSVERYLGRTPGQCRCRDCILDAAAIALNKLPPRYHVYSFHENQPSEESDETKAEVDKAVAAAFKLVSKKPHHI